MPVSCANKKRVNTYAHTQPHAREKSADRESPGKRAEVQHQGLVLHVGCHKIRANTHAPDKCT